MRVVVEHVLNAHGFMRTEAPPEPWQPEADDETFFRLLGEMIAAGLARGTDLPDLTLSFSNVVIEALPSELTWTIARRPLASNTTLRVPF